MALRLATATVDAQAEALRQRLTGGTLRIYEGAQPENADEALIAGAHAIAEVGLVSFTHPVAGVIALAESAADENAAGSGTGEWFRCVDATGSPVLDGAAAELELTNGGVIMAGARVDIERFMHRVAK